MHTATIPPRDQNAGLPSPMETRGQLTVGEEASLLIGITPEMVAEFTRLSGDDAPLHTDAAYATRRGFQGTLVHGVLLAAYISRIVGTTLPGPSSLLQRMELTWRSPCSAPCVVRVTVTVKQVSAVVRSIRMSVRVEEESGRLLATGETSHSMLPD